MTDRKKVIEHFKDAITASGDGNKWRFVRADIIADAISLLEAQEPIAPKAMDTAIPAGKTAVRIIKTYWCGECGEAVTKFGNNFCPKCGRKVLWDA